MLSSALLSLLAILLAGVHATPSYHEHATHYTRSLPNGSKIKTYYPRSQFETYGSGLQPHGNSSGVGSADYRATALQFVHSKLGADDADLQIVSEYLGPHSKHVWVSQKIGGIPITNTLANVVLNSRGEVVSFGSSLVPTKKGSSLTGSGSHKTTPRLSPEQACKAAVASLGGQSPPSQKPALQFLVNESGNIELAYAVRMLLKNGHSVEAQVNADSGKVRGVVDYTAELSIRAVPFQKANILDGAVLLKNVEDTKVSPKGWTFGPVGFPTGFTVGNNVIVSAAAEFTSADTLDYPYNLGTAPDTPVNRNAAASNAFYVVNTAHDVLYRYGFTESTFNFQWESFVKGGKAKDPVDVAVQDPSFKNNAFFTTLPDGEVSFMQMFLWDLTTPERDSAMDNGVILHEMAHGLTNRMTGGGTGQCLQTTEAGGLGEGWSDSFADWAFQTAFTHLRDFTIGGYLVNSTRGIRSHPYSIFRATNPLTYADLNTRNEVHDIGEVWAQTLHNVLASLMRQLGGSTDALTNPDSTKGQAVFMRLFIDSLAIQPCNPTFLDARNAWIQADFNRYGGKHNCALWLGFAYVGLGTDAKPFTNSIRIPKGCQIPPQLRADYAAIVA